MPDASPAWLPPEAPLVMAPQELSAAPSAARARDGGLCESDLWRALAFGLTLLTVILVGLPIHDALRAGGQAPLAMIAFVLFELLFGWVVFSLVIMLIGVAAELSHEHDLPQLQPATPLATLTSRIGVLVPVHNETPEPVLARLEQMARATRDLDAAAAFDFFVLSDTRDPQIARAEVGAFAGLRARLGERVFYRRRTRNNGRKAGNVADWVARFGGAYDFMVVLDADSLMSGEALVRLAGAIEAHPGVGIIQTVPCLVGRISVFGRVQQFASRLYGPPLINGMAQLWGTEGNYWGHNAIIRVRAFADQAGLPVMKGPGPFGGDIISHDFVEAALLRRAGWEVRIAPRLPGSYEECPPTLPDLIVRDRRWCQGNIQHLGLLRTRGLHWMSRFHMAQGALAYLTSPLWLCFLLVTAVMAANGGTAASADWDPYRARVLSWALSTTFVCLFAPRLIALGMLLSKPSARSAWGGPGRLIGSVLLETALSALIAPIMMMSQTEALLDILRGRDSGWKAQRREDSSIGWGDALRLYGAHAIAGALMGVFFYLVSPLTFAWAVPVVAGLMLAPALAVLTADPAIGAWFLRRRLFVTPEETALPPREAQRDPATPPEFAGLIAATPGPEMKLGG